MLTCNLCYSLFILAFYIVDIVILQTLKMIAMMPQKLMRTRRPSKLKSGKLYKVGMVLLLLQFSCMSAVLIWLEQSAKIVACTFGVSSVFL